MNSSQLKIVADNLQSKAGLSTVANANDAGWWKKVALAAEGLAGASTTANDSTHGYMLRAAKAMETYAGGSGAEENANEAGFLKRLVDAMEIKAGAIGTGSIENRAVVAAIASWISAYATYALALDFDNPEYWVSGTQYGAGEPTLLNSLTYSQEFNNWTATNVTVIANDAVAPDGTTTADKITPGGTTIQKRVQRGPTWDAGDNTVSVYVKKGGHRYHQMYSDDGGVAYANFDVQTGAVATSGSVSAYTVDAGDYYRLVCVWLAASAPSANLYLSIIDDMAAAWNAASASTTPYHLWQAQHLVGNFPTGGPIIATTINTASSGAGRLPGYTFTRSGIQGAVDAAGAVAFFAANTPAINSAGYHAYGALTNPFLQSQVFDNGSWPKQNVTVVADNAAAPDGTTTADTFTSTSTTSADVYQSITTVSTSVYTTSVFVPSGGTSTHAYIQANLAAGVTVVAINRSTGVVGAKFGPGVMTGYSVAVTGGWRLNAVWTADATTTIIAIGLSDSDTSTAVTNGRTCPFWQAQTLLGNFPDGGPLIATGAATASIGASVLTDTITAPTDVDQVFLARFTSRTSAGTQDVFQAHDGTANNRILLRASGGALVSYVIVAGATVVNHTVGGFTSGTEYRMVLKREAGAWRTGYLVAGVLTWFAAATTAAFPAGMVNVLTGHDFGGGQANSSISVVSIKVGTFTDAALQTLMAEM